MIIPDEIVEPVITLKDQYFDLKGLSVYSALKIPTLRDHIIKSGLPCFKVKGKILVRRSEFDLWIEQHRCNKKQDINNIVQDVLNKLKKP